MTMVTHPWCGFNRTAGDIVAVIVAETDGIARIGLSTPVMTVTAVTDVYAAIADGAPSSTKNIRATSRSTGWRATMCVGRLAGAEAAGMELFDIDVINNRVIINSMETLDRRPGDEGSLDIWCGTQGPVGVAEQIADALGRREIRCGCALAMSVAASASRFSCIPNS